MAAAPLLHVFAGDQELILWAVFGYVMYFLPFGVAVARSSSEQWRVLVLNAFTGWTIVGWFAALVVAVRS